MTPTEAIADLRTRHRSVDIARAAGVTKGMVWRWQAEGYVPTLTTALLIDEALGAHRLVEAVRAYRTQPCRTCGREYIPGNKGGIYCSRKCQTEARRERERETRESTRHDLNIRLAARLRMERRIKERLRKAIDGICAICPEGPDVCGNGMCPAHPVTRHRCVVGGCAVHRGQHGREGAA